MKFFKLIHIILTFFLVFSSFSFAERENFNMPLKEGSINGHNIFSVLGTTSRQNNTISDQKETIEYYLRQKENTVTQKCKNALAQSHVTKSFDNKYTKEQLQSVCSGKNLVLNPASSKNWVVLKTGTVLENETKAYPIEFDWNGELLHPKEDEEWNGEGWEFKEASFWERFFNATNGVTEITAAIAMLSVAENLQETEQALALITSGKEKLDKDGETIIAVLEDTERALDAWTAASFTFSTSRAFDGGNIVTYTLGYGSAAGSTLLKHKILNNLVSNGAESIVRNYSGKEGFVLIKQKLEDRIFKLLQNGKVTWNGVNDFFIKAGSQLDRFLGYELAFAGGDPNTSAGKEKVKGNRGAIFSKLWGKPNAQSYGKVSEAVYKKMKRKYDSKVRPGFWKEVYEKHGKTGNKFGFTKADITEMKQGKAPWGSDNEKMEIHHIVPLEYGGANSYSNFRIMTKTEHRLNGNMKKNHTPPFTLKSNSNSYVK